MFIARYRRHRSARRWICHFGHAGDMYDEVIRTVGIVHDDAEREKIEKELRDLDYL